MSEIKHIHVVTFHVPFPPNYGGAIDVFYKLKALIKAGYSIILHTFLYDGKRSVELEEMCETVYYYKRDTSFLSQISMNPFIVQSRKNEKLIEDLLKDNYPILFEGLHTCAFLNDKRLRNRKKYVRMHNIEHDYYRMLAIQSSWGIKKVFYYLESLKLRRYQSILQYAERILSISQADTDYLRKMFPKKDVRLLRCFFDDSSAITEVSSEKYILYHGNLAVAENVTAAMFIMKEVIPLLSTDHKFIFAGRNPSPVILSEAVKHTNISVIANPDERQMNNLLYNATVNILITFQPTGIKLKLLNTLCKSRGYCLVNNEMLQGNDLACFCKVVNNAREMSSAIDLLMDKSREDVNLEERIKGVRKLGYNDISPIVS